MPLKDFWRWWEANQPGPNLEPHARPLAQAAWLAAEEHFLNQPGRNVAETIALEILRGDQSNLPVLVDFAAEKGWLDEMAAKQLKEFDALWRTLSEAEPGEGWPIEILDEHFVRDEAEVEREAPYGLVVTLPWTGTAKSGRRRYTMKKTVRLELTSIEART